MSIIYGFSQRHPIGQESGGVKITAISQASVGHPGSLIRLAEGVKDRVSISPEAREKLIELKAGESNLKLITAVDLSGNSG
ncbi:MAG: hypothetical protein PHG91_09560 [Syntrophales bacterium]|nr:hypothetical protein [Syntrophales bacterium]MDD5233630.1 hypothetical protein [Syntrophales bacterium]MDD5531719.1 hypothetical protein [Syntrophales bacterium]